MVELMICPYGVTEHQFTEQMFYKPHGHRTPRGAGHSPEGGCVFREAESDTSSKHITNSSFGNMLFPAIAGLLPCALLTVPHGHPAPNPFLQQ